MSARPHGASVRSQLLWPLLWVWVLGLTASVLGAYWLARTSANSAFDRGLQDEASALAAKVTWSDRGPLLDLSRQTMEVLTWDGDDRNGFVMVDADGNALAGDATVPIPPTDVRRASFAQPLLFDASFDGEPVRGVVFSVTSPMLDRAVAVVVVETTRRRTELMRDIQLSIVLPALGLGLVSLLLINWGIRRGLQALKDVAQEVARRDAQDWRPLSLMQVPKEAVPLIERINTLLVDMEQSSLLQRRFVADAAHQLRTPVAGIRVLSQALSQELATVLPSGGQDAPEWQALLVQLGHSTDHLSRLIGQLLSLARSETALSVDAEQETLDLVPLVRESAEPMVLRSLREGRSIVLEAPDQPVFARAHALWLGEVVVNLLDNALRYGGEHIAVRIAARAGGGGTITVEDDGPGVTAEQLPRLFEPFWRGERADLRNDNGTGLGLAIAREIVLRLGGQLQAVSRPEVNGMRFVIELAA
ncbi:sensor histidine kinase [Ideonella sp.]|uniref:sensor histidine kinase n=1 Tax=Ideonella sp. TaxID=1929293 RepID=UPI0037C087D6